MAVTYLNENHQAVYGGLSADIKPLNVGNGAIFYEMDTSDIYMFDKENVTWYKQKNSGGGGGGEQVQSDWNQNDSAKPDFIKNRVCYTKDPVESVFANEQSVVLNRGQGLIQTDKTEIKSLTKYKVVINGDEYIEESHYEAQGGVYIVGNIITGDPFAVAFKRGQCAILTTKYTGTITISIQETYKEPVKLPEIYLPERILKSVGQTTPETGEIFNNYLRNKATGQYSHAEGSYTTASGDYGSHAEGDSATATGDSSHAEGYSATASGYASHAEGYSATATGDSSHAEGDSATASSYASHAEGEGTTASGDASHAEGEGTTASSAHQHSQGKYNIDDPTGVYAHIVGNGEYGANSNAHTLDWKGNAWYQASVLVGGTDMDAPDASLLPDGIIIKAQNSTKKFKITVDDTGVIKATQV